MPRPFLIAVLCLSSTQAFGEDKFVSLFNGKDLRGWTGDTDLWSVEDGAITGKTRGPDHLPYNKFLIWTGGKVKDFELRLKFRMEGANNSGVQYRSKQLKDAGDHVVAGYQADIHGNLTYTGMLYDERGRGILALRGQKVIVAANGKIAATKLPGAIKPVDLSEWHELTIIAQGNRLIHKLDGKVTVDVVDNQPSERELEGIVALQVHRGPAMKVQFKDILLKSLQPTEQAAAVPSWIWLTKAGKPEPSVFFRKTFTVPDSVESVRLVGTCDNTMTVFVDDQRILEHGRWDVPIARKLTLSPGTHTVAIQATNTGENNPAGLLMSIELTTSEGVRVVSTDKSWLANNRPRRGWRQQAFEAKGWRPAEVIAELGGQPWTSVTQQRLETARELRDPTATAVESMRVAEGFKVELLYSVPKSEQGSWVSMCQDPKGRLIVCDQYGGLFRVTPQIAGSADPIKIEKIDVDIGEAQGLLYAFDSLYVVVNKGKKYASGVYRVRDSDGDDQFDSLETLRILNGGGEHGPHAILPTPDGESLYVVCGNGTLLTELAGSRVPRVWDEDVLLPRTYGRGFMKGRPAPGGYISRIDPDGKEWELIAVGFRNEFDAAVNADGELFTFDADMEWDINTPWYRPTRVCHVVSGAEFGWRNGSGKWPSYYPDSLPATVDIGPGSPTGICFGYNAAFPAKYQRALYINDWSYGKLYAVHLAPDGATYKAEVEEFVSGTPLPLTDIIINSHDGAMYFAIGGRRVQSGLYRVTYQGKQPTEPAQLKAEQGKRERALRHRLEQLHVGDHPDAVDTAWPYLGHEDRFIRYAARVALEHRPVSEWQQRALDEQDTPTLLTALLALVRQFPRSHRGEGVDIDSPAPEFPVADPLRREPHGEVIGALSRLRWDELTTRQQIELLRVYTLTFVRLGPPDEATRTSVADTIAGSIPSRSPELNSEVAQMLVYLQSPQAASKVVGLLESAGPQEAQIDFAKTLRHLKAGWTDELQESYFGWFSRASGFRGGASFGLFVQHVKEDAVAMLSEERREALKPILEAKVNTDRPQVAAKPRKFVRKWTIDALVPTVEAQLRGRDFERGKEMFAAANCFSCHRFDNQGGAVGPDLTSLAGRFSRRDILESILDPSKVISDQYEAVTIVTFDGNVVTGRIVNLSGDSIRVNTDMLDPNAQANIDRKEIEQMVPSKVSMMPAGLLDTLSEDEILDLMAYLLSGGNSKHELYAE